MTFDTKVYGEKTFREFHEIAYPKDDAIMLKPEIYTCSKEPII